MGLPVTPANGDVIVVEERSLRRYVLRLSEGEAQIAYREREQAIAGALSYAKRASVDVWYSPDGVRFELMNVSRVAVLV